MHSQNRNISLRSKRGVAQPGSAPGLGPGGRRFESCRPDKKRHIIMCLFFLFHCYPVNFFYLRVPYRSVPLAHPVIIKSVKSGLILKVFKKNSDELKNNVYFYKVLHLKTCVHIISSQITNRIGSSKEKSGANMINVGTAQSKRRFHHS